MTPDPLRVAVLGSGVTLGVYVPALLVSRQLSASGLSSRVEVLENVYRPEAREKLHAHKAAYHERFAVAQLGHRMTRDVSPSLDPDQVEQLLSRWEAEGCLRFIMWSGFWIPVIERYRARVAPRELQVDLCRIDAEVSATFRVYARDGREYLDGREIWLWDGARGRLDHQVRVDDAEPLPFAARAPRCVAHGGGWGIGTYAERAQELAAQGLALDVVAYTADEATRELPGARYFMTQPGWSPWERGPGGEHVFPPFGEVRDPASPGPFRNRPERHEIYDLVREARAIVSKPGGGTLIDSLAAATPLILLEPYGYAEESNAAIWEQLGFGIRYEAWRERGFDPGVLEELHQNLLACPRPRDYARRYAEEALSAAATA